jgi:hypothetical protein
MLPGNGEKSGPVRQAPTASSTASRAGGAGRTGSQGISSLVEKVREAAAREEITPEELVRAAVKNP